MGDDEKEVKKFVEKYIEVLTTGKTKFVEQNVDLQAMYEKDGVVFGEYGLSKRMSLKEYEESFKTTLSFMKKGWDKKFEFESCEFKDDEAIVQIKAEGEKRKDQPLILKKIKGKWKIIWIPTWAF